LRRVVQKSAQSAISNAFLAEEKAIDDKTLTFSQSWRGKTVGLTDCNRPDRSTDGRPGSIYAAGGATVLIPSSRRIAMDEKKLWHTPICRSLDAQATASDSRNDDPGNGSMGDDFASPADASGAHDHSTPGQSDFS
jgi:hypothetical protein